MTRFIFRKIVSHVAALIVVLLGQPAVSGQNPDQARQQSHGKIPGAGLADHAQLQERLRRARLASDFHDLVQQSRADSRFLEQLQKNPERQKEIEALLRAVLKDHPALEESRARQLEGLLRDWGGKNGMPPQGLDPGLWKQLEESAKASKQLPMSPSPSIPPAANPTPDPTRTPQPNGPTPNNGQPSTPEASANVTNPFATAQRTGFEERFMRWAQQFIERNPSFRDSNVMKSIIAELDRLRFARSIADE